MPHSGCKQNCRSVFATSWKNQLVIQQQSGLCGPMQSPEVAGFQSAYGQWDFSFPRTVHDTIPFLCTGSQPHILYQSAESIYRPTMVGSLLATSSYNNSLYSSTASTTTSNRYQQPLTHFSGHTGFQYVAANPQGSYQSSSIHPRQALAYGQYPVQVLQQVPMQATYLSPSGLVQATGGGSSMTTSAIDQTADNSYVYTSTASQRLYPNSGYPQHLKLLLLLLLLSLCCCSHYIFCQITVIFFILNISHSLHHTVFIVVLSSYNKS